MGVTADGYPWIEDPDQPADMLAWTAEAAGAAQTVLDTHEMAPDPHGVYVRKAGGTMTGPLVLPGDATAALQAVPKQQLDAVMSATGLAGMRVECRTAVVTTNSQGNASVTFTKPFSSPPMVLAVLGDTIGSQTAVMPWVGGIRTTGFDYGGIGVAGVMVRLNYIAIGPA